MTEQEKKPKKEKILTPAEKIEQSIMKKYRRQIWTPFIHALKNYELIQPKDRVCVCISGGKDSMLLAKLMQMLHRFSDYEFELVFLVMDPGYNQVNREKIESNARLLEIPITIFETQIFDIANETPKSPCYLCARMRRGNLYAKAKELGCNKIALGHHFSDVIETTLMGMLYGAQLQGMMPKLHSLNFEGMELIRPLYEIHEEDIIAWRDYNHLEFIQCACRFTENTITTEEGSSTSKRKETKEIIKRLREMNPDVEQNIFNSLHNVSLDTFLEYKTDGQRHSFLENYDMHK
jgi:tRNA(Ile)-lysidine synthase TilS/MesJ